MKDNNHEQVLDLCTRRFSEIPSEEQEEIMRYLEGELLARTLNKLFLGRITMEGAKALVKSMKE